MQNFLFEPERSSKVNKYKDLKQKKASIKTPNMAYSSICWKSALKFMSYNGALPTFFAELPSPSTWCTCHPTLEQHQSCCSCLEAFHSWLHCTTCCNCKFFPRTRTYLLSFRDRVSETISIHLHDSSEEDTSTDRFRMIADN